MGMLKGHDIEEVGCDLRFEKGQARDREIHALQTQIDALRFTLLQVSERHLRDKPGDAYFRERIKRTDTVLSELICALAEEDMAVVGTV